MPKEFIKYTPETGYARAQELIRENMATRATTLDLGNLCLDDVPPELAECTWVERLNLGNRFYLDREGGMDIYGQGDSSAENLNRLSELTCESLPAEKLKLLSFSGSGVMNLRGLERCQQLTELNLFSTKVEDISPLSSLLELMDLNLGNTEITDLSPLSGLIKLNRLGFFWTKVIDLSPLSELRSLAALSLYGTEVTDLTPLLSIDRIEGLSLLGCPNLNYPPEIFNRSSTAHNNLKSWHADLERGTHPNNLYKLIICGNGTVGKTKIAKRIETGKYPEEGGSTHGVQLYLTDEKAFAPNQDPIRFAIWDFAGQELYYQLHRQFFHERAVYLVVIDAKTWNEPYQPDPITGRLDENRPLDYWLNDIRAAAGKEAQIILVQNQIDKDKEIDVASRLPEEFKHLPLIRLSALTGKNFDELLLELHRTVPRLPRANMPIPQSWWAVREEIMKIQLDETDGRQMISRDDFFAICRAQEVCADSEEALLAYLDGSGVVIYSPKLFQNEQIIIDQQWALNAIYTVLDRVSGTDDTSLQAKFLSLFQENCALKNGCFLPKDLPFTKDLAPHRALFLEIMVRSGLCFRTNAQCPQSGETYYLMFQYLREDRPGTVDGIWSAHPEKSVAHQRYAFAHHLHKGVFRGVVKAIFPKVSLDHIWQHGLLLRWQSALALVEVSYATDKPHLTVSATGPSHERDHLLAAFRKLLDEELGAGSTHEIQVSNDGENWFTQQAIEQAADGEAKYARTVTGEKLTTWTELKWCLRKLEEANFSAIPLEAHQNQVDAAAPGGEERVKICDQLSEKVGTPESMLKALNELRPFVVGTKLQENLLVLRGDVRNYQGDRIGQILSEDELARGRRGIHQRVLRFINLVKGG